MLGLAVSSIDSDHCHRRQDAAGVKKKKKTYLLLQPSSLSSLVAAVDAGSLGLGLSCVIAVVDTGDGGGRHGRQWH